MTDYLNETPWIEVNGGQLVTANLYNETQQRARAEIKQMAAQLEGEIQKVEGELDNVDAARFGGKTPQEWGDEFAAKVHDHEGQSVYRRYIKHFEGEEDEALLTHNLGRYPLVDVYQLDDVVAPGVNDRFNGCKILFYGKTDADQLKLRTKVYRDSVDLGVSLEEMLKELGVPYEDDDYIEDVLKEMWDALRKDPNDEVSHCTTAWVEECCERHRTVKELREGGPWDDLSIAMRPRKTGRDADTDTYKVIVAQVNYNTLHIRVDEGNNTGKLTKPVDLMFLLRA